MEQVEKEIDEMKDLNLLELFELSNSNDPLNRHRSMQSTAILDSYQFGHYARTFVIYGRNYRVLYFCYVKKSQILFVRYNRYYKKVVRYAKKSKGKFLIARLKESLYLNNFNGEAFDFIRNDIQETVRVIQGDYHRGDTALICEVNDFIINKIDHIVNVSVTLKPEDESGKIKTVTFSPDNESPIDYETYGGIPLKCTNIIFNK